MQQADCSCHQGLTDLSCGAFVRQHRFLQAENPVTAAVASVTECQHGGSIIQLSWFVTLQTHWWQPKCSQAFTLTKKNRKTCVNGENCHWAEPRLKQKHINRMLLTIHETRCIVILWNHLGACFPHILLAGQHTGRQQLGFVRHWGIIKTSCRHCWASFALVCNSKNALLPICFKNIVIGNNSNNLIKISHALLLDRMLSKRVHNRANWCSFLFHLQFQSTWSSRLVQIEPKGCKFGCLFFFCQLCFEKGVAANVDVTAWTIHLLQAFLHVMTWVLDLVPKNWVKLTQWCLNNVLKSKNSEMLLSSSLWTCLNCTMDQCCHFL